MYKLTEPSTIQNLIPQKILHIVITVVFYKENIIILSMSKKLRKNNIDNIKKNNFPIIVEYTTIYTQYFYLV